MDYLGKAVKPTSEFISSHLEKDEDCLFRSGVVIDQMLLPSEKYILTVDDSIFGTWKILSTNVEVATEQ